MSGTPSFARLLAVVLVLVARPGLAAEHHDEALHQPLPEAEDLTLAEAVDRTLARYPDAVELPARQAQSGAWRSRSASLLADQPSLSFRYQTDRWGDDAGLTEYEAGVELPLWRWGERHSARALADALATETGDAESAMRWQVAGRLRLSLWAMADAERALASAERAHDIARRLQASVERRHELGDVPLGDVLLARAAALTAEESVVDARAAVVDAHREFEIFTGLEFRPPYRQEALSDRSAIEPRHPALALAQAELERARARADLTRHQSRGAPTLLIGPRWERPALGNGYDDSIGVTLTVPIPGTAHAGTDVADAGREVAAAQAARDRVVRTLQLALHEAAHGLEVARENLTTARLRSELARRHTELGRRAYEQGEMDLMDLLRLEEAAVAAARQLGRLEVAVDRQIALYNQAVGDMP